MTVALPPPPGTMAALPRDHRGRPVPWAAAWSSERWAAIRHDPVIGRRAIFSAGRQGRGRPVLGVLNEERQRYAMVAGQCQVCRQPIRGIRGLGWLPDTVTGERTVLTEGGTAFPTTTEPPCCYECASWAMAACPGLRDTTGLWRIVRAVRIVQLVDPSRAPAAHQGRFGPDDPAGRERLGKIARRTGGVAGYVKLVLTEVEAAA